MFYRHLGTSGLRVSALSFGSMTFGGGGMWEQVGSTGAAEARGLIDRCLEAGVNLFDTADGYADGRSEEILGQALGDRRDRVLLASKVRFPVGDGPNDAGLSRHHIVRACEATLRRLGTDHLDLYQLHAPDAYTPIEETLGALDDLVRQGKVRYVGCSNYPAWQLTRALGVSERRGFERFVSMQAYYNVGNRDAEHELVPACRAQGVGVITWSPLAGGLLSRAELPPAGSRHGQGAWAWTPVDEQRLPAVRAALGRIAGERGVSMAQVALNWLVHRPGVASVTIGARTPEQLADNLAAVAWTMAEDERAELDRASEPPEVYPAWELRLGDDGRMVDPLVVAR